MTTTIENPVEINPNYTGNKLSNGDFMSEPSIVLHGVEGVQSVLDDPSIIKGEHPFKYQVKSPWLIEIIYNLIASNKPRQFDGITLSARDFAYNIDVQIEAERQLGTGRTEKEMRENPTVLSTLVYNAQGFRRSDMLREEGYSPLTQAMIEQAFTSKNKIEVGGTVCTPRKVEGKVYLFKPRKRKYAISPGNVAAKIV